MTTNGESLSTKDTIAYAVIGIALGIIYVGAFMIILNVMDSNDDISIDDFPLEKFSQGYDAICINRGCLIKNSDDTDFGFSKDGYYYFRSIDTNKTIKVFDDRSGNSVTNNPTGFTFEMDVFKVIYIELDIWLFEPIIENSIIPKAYAQIQPFEQQLAQIRDPAECTRKVVRGASAQTPFLIKVFYDTTADRSLSFKQQGTSFPVTQTTNQVMTFFTSEVDQFEIHMEMNYRIPKERQIYIEYLTGGSIVQSEQEKFDGTKFCMTLFANTNLPPTIPTKEEIFGQSLEFVNQIPLMIDSFNRNTYTQSTTIAYMWMLILGVLFFSVITFISVQVGNRKFKLKMRDVDDIVTTGSTLVTSMDSMINSVSKPLQEVSRDLKKILNLPQVKEKLEQVKEPKESKAKAIIKKMLPKKKKEDYQVTIIEEDDEQEKDLDDEDQELEEQAQREDEKEDQKKVDEGLEVKEELKSDQKQSEKPDQTPETRPVTEPSGGFIQGEVIEEEIPKPEPASEPEPEQKQPEPEKELKIEKKPANFKRIVDSIDYENKKLSNFSEFTYPEILQVYTWITNFRKRQKKEGVVIPEDVEEKQLQIQEITYYAIFAKLKEQKNGTK